MNPDRIIEVTSKKILYNEFYGDPSSNYVYVPMLKNAHTFGIGFFRAVANFELTQNFKDKNYIIFVRDPLKRWMSGIAQWFNLYVPSHLQNSDFVMDPLMMNLILHAIDIDPHTHKQSDTLDLLNLDRATFFNLDDHNFSNNLIHFVETKMNCIVRNKKLYKVHTSVENPFKTHIINLLQQSIHYEQFITNFRHYYRKDFNYYKNLPYFTNMDVRKEIHNSKITPRTKK